jgi:uncharacterized phage protein gp47/JayE
MGYSAPSFGLLSTGFVPKLTSDVLLDLTTKLRLLIDPNLDVAPTEPFGQAVGIFSGQIAEVWELLGTIYGQTDPNKAEGFLLDAVCAITGTIRKDATFSHVVVTMNMGASATINAGLIANVNGLPGNQWQLIGTADASGNLLTAGPVVSTSAGNYASYWQATVTGPQTAAAGQLTVVPSLPAGLVSITNAADAIIGTVRETDAQLRIRRTAELSAAGGGTMDGIRADVLNVPNVVQCSVFENTTDFTDSSGRPPHSFEVVVFDGVTPLASSNDIAQAIWNDKPAGIPSYSATGDFGIAIDSQGNNRTVPFSRAQVVNVYLNLTTVATGSEAAVKSQLAAFALANLGLGSEVYRLQLMGAVLPFGEFPVAGVVDVPTFALDTVGPASAVTATANLVLTARQFPYIQTAHMQVNLI